MQPFNHSSIFSNQLYNQNRESINKRCQYNSPRCHIVFPPIEQKEKAKIRKNTNAKNLHENFHFPDAANVGHKLHTAVFHLINDQEKDYRNQKTDGKSHNQPVGAA